jgi:mannonate dehydratase
MRIAVGQSPIVTEEYLTFARQVGARGVQFNTPELPGRQRWLETDIRLLVDRVEEAGLVVEAFENMPNHFYDKAMLGATGRDEQIENVQASIRAMGAAGVPILGFNWLPQSVWRTGLGHDGRGGAYVSGYDHAIAADEARANEVWVARRDLRVADAKDSWTRGSFIPLPDGACDEDAMWANYEYFVRAVVPVAEEANVVLAFHPDDPPVESLHGVAHILRNVDALVRAATTVDSPYLASELCLGTVSEMGGEPAVLDAVARLGALGKIAYVHLRDVRGMVPVFRECFLGEGNYAPHRVIRALEQVGFTGFILDDHTPGLVGDDPYGYRGRAQALGYIQALIDVVDHDDAVAG